MQSILIIGNLMIFGLMIYCTYNKIYYDDDHEF
jgi:hypothetical protein